MNVQFVDLAAQYEAIREDVRREFERLMSRGSFVLGPAVQEFEEAFAAYCGTEHCVGVASGADALQLSLMAAGVGPGHEVITAANTFIATANAIHHAGAIPVLADVTAADFNLDPALLEQAITERTKAIVPVHLYGQPAEMDPIMEIAARHDLLVIEDACQAHGATYRGRRVGGLGHAGCFSFYPAKNLGSFGEGGAVTTNDAGLADELRMLRNVGQSEKYIHPLAGFNSRLQSMQAAVLKLKLRHLDEWNALRQGFAQRYRALLADAPGVVLPGVKPHIEHVWHLFVMQHVKRDALLDALQEQGIGAGIHYPIPIAQQEAFRGVQTVPHETPVTDVAAGRILSLPMHPHLTEEQVAHVAEAVHAFAQSNAS
ncbi:MAG: DegT/DnrJ/EryC1/StrS family aminotransferase [Candidatus Hydrogenedentota bacterium]